MLAFLKGGDVWTLEVPKEGRSRAAVAVQRSRIAAPDVRVRSFRWSPDSQQFAVLEADESGVPLCSIPDYLTEEPTLVRLRRAYPGDEPTRTRVGLVDAGRNDPQGAFQPTVPQPTDARWIELNGEPAPDMILSYRWSPDGKRLALDTSDLYAKDRRVWVADISGGATAARVVTRDLDPENETFYFWRIAWSTDSRLLYFLSDRSQDYHVWAVDAATGGNVRQLTSGSWAVAEMHPVNGGLIVVGNQGRPEERQLFLVSNRGGEAGAGERSSRDPLPHPPLPTAATPRSLSRTTRRRLNCS